MHYHPHPSGLTYIVNLSIFVLSDAEMPAHAHYLKVAELECVAFRLQLEGGATSIELVKYWSDARSFLARIFGEGPVVR